jgi:hypothetical protein
VSEELLGSVGKGGGLGAADFALSDFLLLDEVGVDVGLLGSRGVFDLGGQVDALVVAALVAVLGYFPVGFCVEVLGFYCRDVAHVAWHVGIYAATHRLLLFLDLVGRHVAHVTDDGVLLRASFDHQLSYIITLL